MEFINEDPLLGTAINGYTIEKKLGGGGFGKVYLGINKTIDRKAAIKILHTEFCDSEVIIQRFISEAKAVNKINHPNIIQVFDFNKLNDGRFYFIMEYVDGEELTKLINREGPLSVQLVTDILGKIVKALDAAHKTGIIHRDLKPDNIMIYDGWEGKEVKILDFGIAKLLSDRGSSIHQTKTGQVLGTPAYMSPEQAKGEHDLIAPTSDIYSLGVIAYQMLCGELPISGNSVVDLLVNIVMESPKFLYEVNPAICKELSGVISGTLEKDPKNRPQSAGDFYEQFISTSGVLSHDKTIASQFITKKQKTSKESTIVEQSKKSKGKPNSEKIKNKKDKKKKKTKKSTTNKKRWFVFGVLFLLIVAITLGGFTIFNKKHKPASKSADINDKSRNFTIISRDINNKSYYFLSDEGENIGSFAKIDKSFINIEGEKAALFMANDNFFKPENFILKHLKTIRNIYISPVLLCNPRVIKAIINSGDQPLFISILLHKREKELSCLKQFSQLTLYLDLSNIKNYTRDLKAFANIKGFIAKGNSAGNRLVSILTNNNNLELLSLTKSHLNDRGLSNFSHLTELQTIILSFNKKIKGSGFSSFNQITNLKKLVINNSKITDRAVHFIKNNDSIQYLDLSESPKISDIGVKELSTMINLRTLKLGGIKTTLKIEKNPLKTITSIFSLKSKDFGLDGKKKKLDTKIFNSKGIKKISSAFTDSIKSPALITNRASIYLAKLKNLEYLSLNNSGITDKGLVALKKLKKLKILSLINCNISCEAVKKLKIANSNLEIKLMKCEK
jgi:serine/threonine protein kinase